jgi:hypothetical protein
MMHNDLGLKREIVGLFPKTLLRIPLVYGDFASAQALKERKNHFSGNTVEGTRFGLFRGAPVGWNDGFLHVLFSIIFDFRLAG